MRAVVRWLTLLVGVAIVAAMAWYGARALFGDEDPTRIIGSEESPAERECEAASEAAARSAERTFMRQYVKDEADAAWFGGAGTSNTDVLPEIIEQQAAMQDYTVLPVRGEGSFVLVMVVPGSTTPDLPACIGEVVTYGGPFVAS